MGFAADDVKRISGDHHSDRYCGRASGNAVYLQMQMTQYEIDDIILSEYGTTVVGLEMMRSVNEENAEETRKDADCKVCDQHTCPFQNWKRSFIFLMSWTATEGILVASKIADRVGITRSVIVNALRKFESAGVIESRSSGMKGTYIKVINDVVFDELAEIKKERKGTK